jgi:hypothetical protein
MADMTKDELLGEIGLVCNDIGGEFMDAIPRFQTLAPGMQCPGRSEIRVATLRRLHRALVTFVNEARADAEGGRDGRE